MRVSIGQIEIPVRDPERAARFYREAFGWKSERLRSSVSPYFKLRNAEAKRTSSVESTFGGLSDPDTLGCEHPLVVLDVEQASLAECLDQIVAAGGAVDKPPDQVGEMGWFARFRDPDGNLLGLWRSAKGDE